ncbi:MAG: hypothetical protein LBR83_08525 [Clostridiales bacterium]|jgi:YbbR domain-containing protein|nr:hypothetical protein [Clostridiales bacterium]
MFKSFFETIFKDLKWKLLSLAIAAALWFVGMNITNPVDTEYYYPNLNLSNLDRFAAQNSIVVLNRNEISALDITASIRDTKERREYFGSISNRLSVSLDVHSIDASLVAQSDVPVRATVDVLFEITEGYELYTRRPSEVEVELDSLVRKTMLLQVYTVGEAAEGYVIHEYEADHGYVTVSGAKSFVDKVAALRVATDAQGAESDFQHLEKIFAYDESGTDITNTVELDITSTRVRVNVLPYKSVPLEVSWGGFPAQNFKMSGSGPSIEPETVNIVGTAEDLRNINRITLEKVSLSDASETFTSRLSIPQALPQGIYLKDDEPTEAAVTFTIEPLGQKEFYYLPEDIHLRGNQLGTSVTLLRDEPILLRVRGAESDIAGLTIEDISAELQLYNLAVGEHAVQLNIKLPSEFTLMGEEPVINVIINPANTGEDTSASDPTEAGLPGETEPTTYDSAVNNNVINTEPVLPSGGEPVTDPSGTESGGETDEPAENSDPTE